jgi:hypothetical protein
MEVRERSDIIAVKFKWEKLYKKIIITVIAEQKNLCRQISRQINQSNKTEIFVAKTAEEFN